MGEAFHQEAIAVHAEPSPTTFDDTRKRFSDFALKDYELKVAYLTNHFQRMWTRFNYFVVIEAALIGGKTIFGDREIGFAGLVFGLALSLVWYVMGAEDRFLVQVYREHVKQAASLLTTSLWPPTAATYRFVGDTSAAMPGTRQSPGGWRFEPTSTTRLAALIPLAVAMVWLGLLVAALVKTS
jgi:hypothetical protein